MKLSDFASSNHTNEKSSKKETENNNKTQGSNFNQKAATDMYNEYKNYDSASLMKKLSEEISKQKKNGTYNPSVIQNSVQAILPYLTEEQKNNILSLLNQIN